MHSLGFHVPPLMVVRSLIGATTVLLLSAASVGAQATTHPDSSARPGDSTRARRDSAQKLQRMVVTGKAARGRYATLESRSATRTDTPLRDTPQSVTVVTGSLIADQAMQTMTDVARYLPGVGMGQGEGHRDQPVIRGNSSTADFFVDGVRDDAQYLRDLYNVERVEALKGPNAMVFGRGGGGGVINRVTKDAKWSPTRSIALTGGSFDQKRGTFDVGQGLGPALAVRMNGMWERSATFRDASGLERWGINPTLALMAGSRTSVHGGYERFSDERVVDRGIPSYRGGPADVDIRTFYGDPDVNHAYAHVDAGTMTVDRALGATLLLRNRTRLTRYDKFYQNIYPGAVTAAGDQVALGAYNHGTDRRNLFNQSDLTWEAATGAVRHVLLAGAELGRQRTDNVRRTGWFGDSATSVLVSLEAPRVAEPVVFRMNASDADNAVTARVAAAYVQDQLQLSRHWQAIVGLRVDRFALAFHDNRTGNDLSRTDRMVSPRAGLVLKPVEPLSLYSSYGVSYLPSSGDQFSSLTATTATLEPERFRNYEVGAKWDVGSDLALTAAVYRLDRSNGAAPDPRDASRLVQTGAQRTTGWELGATGSLTSRWQVAGGWAVQKAIVVSRTTSARAGATVPLVPHHTLSLWNRWQVVPALGAGLGVVHQARVYTSLDNGTTLPPFTRLDAALYARPFAGVRAQLNVENLLDHRYYATSQGNNNIQPGAPRTVRASLTTEF